MRVRFGRPLPEQVADAGDGGLAGRAGQQAVMADAMEPETVLPCAETVPMLLWALLASGQIQMRKVDGWETLSQPLEPMPLDLAA